MNRGHGRGLLFGARRRGRKEGAWPTCEHDQSQRATTKRVPRLLSDAGLLERLLQLTRHSANLLLDLTLDALVALVPPDGCCTSVTAWLAWSGLAKPYSSR